MCGCANIGLKIHSWAFCFALSVCETVYIGHKTLLFNRTTVYVVLAVCTTVDVVGVIAGINWMQ